MAEYELNLIPSDIIEREATRERVKLWFIVIVASIAIVSGLSLLIKSKSKNINRDVALLESLNRDLTGELTKLNQLDAKVVRDKELKGRLKLLTNKGPLFKIFVAIDKSINNNITLTHLSGKFSHTELLQEDIKGPGAKTQIDLERMDTLLLQGVAVSNRDLGAMLQSLSMNPLFESVNLTYSRTGESQEEKRIVFEIECGLKEKLL